MTTETRDPAAALAEWLADGGDPDEYDERWTTDRLLAELVVKGLAEQGYVLVNAEGLAAALHDTGYMHSCHDRNRARHIAKYAEQAAAILAAIKEQQR